MPHRLTVCTLSGSAAGLLTGCAMTGLSIGAWAGQDALHLILQVGLPVSAFALGFGGMLVATRRVIAPAARDTALNSIVNESGIAAACAGHGDEVGRQDREAAGTATRQPGTELDIAELEQQVRQMLSQLAGATGASLTTVDGLSAGSGATHRSVPIMSQSSDAATADQIGAAVDVINEMACQNNLLALNAVVDAVRSSEADRGFAATASEVDSLAGQTIEAANQISEQIAEITAALVALSARQGSANQGSHNARNASRDIVGSSAMHRMLLRKT